MFKLQKNLWVSGAVGMASLIGAAIALEQRTGFSFKWFAELTPTYNFIFLIILLIIIVLTWGNWQKWKIFHLKERFHTDTFAHYLSEAKEIFILNTFVPNFIEIKPILSDAISRNIRIKVLLLNPNCPEVQYRAETLGENQNHIKSRINESIKFLQDIYNEVGKQKQGLLELKLYESFAPFSLYSTNRGSLVGFYMNEMLAVEGPQLVISTKHDLFVKFIGQFDYMWENAKVFNLSENDWRNVLDRMQCTNEI